MLIVQVEMEIRSGKTKRFMVVVVVRRPLCKIRF
jgi:hypothetical protein